MIDEADLTEKLFAGEDLEPVERRKALPLARAMLRGFEAQAYQHEVGLLDESEWNFEAHHSRDHPYPWVSGRAVGKRFRQSAKDHRERGNRRLRL